MLRLDYLRPFFGQSWRLFAPNPVDDDKTLLVQGAYVDDDGELQTTAMDQLDGGRAGRHRAPPGRRARRYITTKFYPSLDEEFQELESQEQKTLSERTSPLDPPSWNTLRDLSRPHRPR